MTAYSVEASGDTSTGQLGIRAGVYTVKINNVAIYYSLTLSDEPSFGKFTLNVTYGSSLSGGSSYTPQPLRSGSQAASTTCNYGGLTIGSSNHIVQTIVVGGANYGAGELSWAPPLNFTLAPGDVFWCGNLTPIAAIQMYPVIYFEELYLDLAK